ncbi:hypothetical protein LXA43DRAFT_1184392 [Ganoderma leucocontextum]|nr:hypothetical protein LXA43DRAFT_1184392 [Ganoderma leucocontextum]
MRDKGAVVYRATRARLLAGENGGCYYLCRLLVDLGVGNGPEAEVVFQGPGSGEPGRRAGGHSVSARPCVCRRADGQVQDVLRVHACRCVGSLLDLDDPAADEIACKARTLQVDSPRAPEEDAPSYSCRRLQGSDGAASGHHGGLGGRAGIDYRIIPQTIRDAITVTDGLGMRYVWIDAFCIIQDSDENKVTELVKMGDIYRDAYFTIIASSSPDLGSAGFLQDRVLPPHWRVPFCRRDGRLGSVCIGQRGETASSSVPGRESVDRRAWCFQEWLLSPRKRMYTNDTLRYHCQTSARPVEDSIRAIRTVQSSTLDHAFLPLPQATLANPDLTELSSEELFVCQCMLRGFVAANYRYTPRSLSRQTDELKLLAFATIALAAVRRHLGSGMAPRAARCGTFGVCVGGEVPAKGPAVARRVVRAPVARRAVTDDDLRPRPRPGGVHRAVTVVGEVVCRWHVVVPAGAA